MKLASEPNTESTSAGQLLWWTICLGWNFAETVSGQRGAVTDVWTIQNTKHETSFEPQAVLTGEV